MSASARNQGLSPAMRAHERRLGRPLAVVLVEDYGGWPVERIADEFGVSERTMTRWLERLGIKRRLVLVHPVDGEGARDCARPPNGGAETPANEGEAA